VGKLFMRQGTLQNKTSVSLVSVIIVSEKDVGGFKLRRQIYGQRKDKL